MGNLEEADRHYDEKSRFFTGETDDGSGAEDWYSIAVQDGFIQIAFIIITIIANRRGLSAAAAVGIVEKIISFLFLVPSSMLSTVSALGAQNMGAGKYDRADQILRCAMGIAVGFGYVWQFDSVLLRNL